MAPQRIIGELTKRTRHDGATYFDGHVNGVRVSLFRGRTRTDGREVWNLAVEDQRPDAGSNGRQTAARPEGRPAGRA